MVWVRIDDHFDEHPKIAGLDDHAFALFVSGLAYCNRNLTDGYIPTAVGLGKLRACGGKVKKAAAALEAAGMWNRLPSGGWLVHDFGDYQPTKQQVEDERAKKQAAGQAGGRASAQARASAPAQANGVAGAQAKSKPVPVPVPVPGPGPVPGPDPVPGPGPVPINPDPDLDPVDPPNPPRGKRAKPAHEVLTQVERTDLIVKWQSDYGGMADVADEIDAALNHNARLKCKSERLYVDHWLRKGLESRPAKRRNGHSSPVVFVESVAVEHEPLVSCPWPGCDRQITKGWLAEHGGCSQIGHRKAVVA